MEKYRQGDWERGERGGEWTADVDVHQPMNCASESHYAETGTNTQIAGKPLHVKSCVFFGVIEARKH